VVVDEAYFPFAGGASLIEEVPQHPNLVLIRTVSKLGLAGLRLGLAIGSPQWMREFEKLRPPYNVNVLTMAAAEMLLAEAAGIRRADRRDRRRALADRRRRWMRCRACAASRRGQLRPGARRRRAGHIRGA
jgi:histidinol-phosphate aminotransferase